MNERKEVVKIGNVLGVNKRIFYKTIKIDNEGKVDDNRFNLYLSSMGIDAVSLDDLKSHF